MRILRNFLVGMVVLLASATTFAAPTGTGYQIGPGDLLKISVFGQPDLSLETRVGDNGTISFPLVGEIKVGGLTSTGVETRLASQLERGGFLKKPQVSVLVTSFQSKLVSVIGNINKPGRYPLDRTTNLLELITMAGGVSQDASDLITIIAPNGDRQKIDLLNVISGKDLTQNVTINGGDTVYVHSREVSVLGQVNRPGKYSVGNGVRTVTDFISVAGGIAPTGSDIITVTTVRDGKSLRQELDMDALFKTGNSAGNITLTNGDMIYVPRYPVFYIYGEVNRPGAYRLERNMTVIQSLSSGGGLTQRGTERGVKLKRRDPSGTLKEVDANHNDLLQPDDVVYVRESMF